MEPSTLLLGLFLQNILPLGDTDSNLVLENRHSNLKISITSFTFYSENTAWIMTPFVTFSFCHTLMLEFPDGEIVSSSFRKHLLL